MKFTSKTLQQAIDAMKTGILDDDENAAYFAVVLYNGSLTHEERKEFNRIKGEVLSGLNLPF